MYPREHDPSFFSASTPTRQQSRMTSTSTIVRYRQDSLEPTSSTGSLSTCPPGVREIDEGGFSDGVMPGGSGEAMGPHGCRQGVNDYTSWFAGDPEMAGTYLGYDGPGPPWNDSLVHNYTFTIYAIDIARLPVVGGFTASEVKSAMDGHILGEASVSGMYTLNARLR